MLIWHICLTFAVQTANTQRKLGIFINKVLTELRHFIISCKKCVYGAEKYAVENRYGVV